MFFYIYKRVGNRSLFGLSGPVTVNVARNVLTSCQNYPVCLTLRHVETPFQIIVSQFEFISLAVTHLGRERENEKDTLSLTVVSQ